MAFWEDHEQKVDGNGCFIIDAMRPDRALSFSFDGAGCGISIECVDANSVGVEELSCAPATYFDAMDIYKNSERVAALAVSFLSVYPPAAQQEIIRMAHEIETQQRKEISLEEVTVRVRKALGRT